MAARAVLVRFVTATAPQIDRSFFYAPGLTDGLLEGCGAWPTPDGGCEITTSGLEEEAAKKSGPPLHLFQPRDESTRRMKAALKGHRKVGINAAELTQAAFERLKKQASKSTRFVDVSEAVMKTRLVKDAEEIKRIQRACDIATKSFEETLPFVRSGVAEAEVASELVYRMQKNGATGPSFHTIVGSGPNGAEPHYTAGERKIERGDMIGIDFGAIYHMYCSDVTRTVVGGSASKEQRRMNGTVARAQAASLARMRPGSKAKSVDAAARDLIDRTKYKGRIIHGLGHSIGAGVHDGGALNPSSDLVLRPNMVFTDEPGVYVPGFGGVRIEDDGLITKKGPRYMSTAPRGVLEL